jgi:hypothetical protein
MSRVTARAVTGPGACRDEWHAVSYNGPESSQGILV